MNPSHWRQVEELFHRALEVDAAERAAFLEGACPPELRRAVDRMLRADGLNDQRVEAAIGAAAEVVASGTAPQRIGPYRLVRTLGRGGMGSVFLAEREGADFDQTVAIKMLRGDFDTPLARDRFRLERQIVANLEHPYIARLLDGGETADGRPYLVLEYVDGVPADEWLESRRAGVTERCELFLKLCEAVSYAHANLVVHRDLKPSNLLVASSGQPKLLDFGVAKLMDPAAARYSQGLTRGLMTPEYASPEQVRGEPITTATDVYGLGAILYTLLAGRGPYRFENASAAELVRVICEQELPPPSTYRPVPSDLDHIVLMAMRREAGQRYRSVEALAEDVTRFLRGQPVRASGDSVWYRGRKFLRRRLMAVVVTAGAVALLLGATLVYRRQAEIAERARQVAESERLRAEQQSERARAAAAEQERLRAMSVASAQDAARQRDLAEVRFSQARHMAGRFLFQFDDSVKSLPGSLQARQMVVLTGLSYLDALAKDSPADPGLLRELAAGYERIGDIQGNPHFSNLGDAQGALASYRNAEALRRKLPDGDAGVLADRMHGLVRMADVHQLLGNSMAAEKELDAALTLVPKGAGAAAPGVVEAAAKVYLRRSEVLAQRGRALERERDCREALARFESLHRQDPGQIAYRQGALEARRMLARALQEHKNYAGALALQRTAMAEAEGLVRDDAANAKARRNLLRLHVEVADTLMQLGQRDEAVDRLRAALQLAEASAQAAPEDSQAQADLAEMTTRLARVKE